LAFVFIHLPKNVARCVSFYSFVGVLPDVIKDVFFSDFDSLSCVQAWDF
jgi:hypothetical protein